MSSDIRLALARLLGRHLVRIMPPSRADWAAGMAAEIGAIDDPAAAVAFALGCVRVGYLRRLRTLPGVLAVVRASVGMATVIFATFVLATAHAFTSLATPGALPQVTTGLGLAFLTAGLVTLYRGPSALVAIAAILLALNALGLAIAGDMAAVHAEIYRALILEGLLLWSLLLLVGLTLHISSRSSRLAAFVARHGWAG